MVVQALVGMFGVALIGIGVMLIGDVNGAATSFADYTKRRAEMRWPSPFRPRSSKTVRDARFFGLDLAALGLLCLVAAIAG
jgi:hypothetical protein